MKRIFRSDGYRKVRLQYRKIRKKMLWTIRDLRNVKKRNFY